MQIDCGWIVYKHTFPNGKVYYGITKRDEHSRWLDGKGYQGQPTMFDAIIKYGWDNIKHEKVAYHLSESEARELERRLIMAEPYGMTYNTVYRVKLNEYVSEDDTIYSLCGDIPDKAYEHIIKKTVRYMPYLTTIQNDRVVVNCMRMVDGEIHEVSVESLFPGGMIKKDDFIKWIQGAKWSFVKS